MATRVREPANDETLSISSRSKERGRRLLGNVSSGRPAASAAAAPLLLLLLPSLSLSPSLTWPPVAAAAGAAVAPTSHSYPLALAPLTPGTGSEAACFPADVGGSSCADSDGRPALLPNYRETRGKTAGERESLR